MDPAEIQIPAKLEFMKLDITNNSSQDTDKKQYPDIWTEIPPNGKICSHTGLKHAKLYTLLGKGGLARPYVRVANLRDPGARQGKTIIHVGDMLRFLDFMATKQGSGENRFSIHGAPAKLDANSNKHTVDQSEDKNGD